jgi:hypothetical protein
MINNILQQPQYNNANIRNIGIMALVDTSPKNAH